GSSAGAGAAGAVAGAAAGAGASATAAPDGPSVVEPAEAATAGAGAAGTATAAGPAAEATWDGAWLWCMTVGTAEPERARTIIVSPAKALWTSGLSASGADCETSGGTQAAMWLKLRTLRCRPATRSGTGRKAFLGVALTSVSSSRRHRHLAQASR